jgi:hypothetical protein
MLKNLVQLTHQVGEEAVHLVCSANAALPLIKDGLIKFIAYIDNVENQVKAQQAAQAAQAASVQEPVKQEEKVPDAQV